MGLRKIMRPSSRQKQKELERALNFSNVSDKDMRNHHRAMIMKLAKRAGAKKMPFQKHLYTRKEDFKKTSIEYETDSKDDDTIEQLEADVRRLAKKCEALESQNILVSVQQLDYLARILTMLLCLFALLLYWKVVVFGTNAMNTIAVNGQQSSFFVGLAKNSLTIVLLRGILMSMPFVYNHKTHASINRRFQVFVVAFIVIGRIRLCRWRERTFVQTGINENSSDVGNRINRFGESCTEDGIWEANYEVSARFLYLSILRLRGLWIKTAQYMSSRGDFVPVAYIRELSKLQDQAPVTVWDQAEKLLPSKLRQELSDIDPVPIASASIGQVHTARLRSTNEKVVIKLQHPHARRLMTDDFSSLDILTRIIAWLEPDYGFMRILMNEWAVEARKELDFQFEAKNLRDAQKSLRDLIPSSDHVILTTKIPLSTINTRRVPFQVQIPTPLEDLSNRDVLVMDFCEGCRIDDFEQIESWGLSRGAIMDAVSQTFAHFMYVSTIFNGDPHPGNILVRPGTSVSKTDGFTLVLLDWGLAKRLSEEKRVAFCQMVYAAATFDYGLLLDSYKEIGLKLKREDAGQSMEDMRFFLRDMAPREDSRKRIKMKMRADMAKRKASNEKVPMESKTYPGEFFFFIRVHELLHGLGGRYDVSVEYLEALKPYAGLGLRRSSINKFEVPLLKAKMIEDSILQNKLKDLLVILDQEGKIAGCQICVLSKGGTTQVDVIHGHLGGLRSHIPMNRTSLILGYSTTKAVTATIAHLMVKDGYLSYDEPLCDRVWKKFCPHDEPPHGLEKALEIPQEEIKKRWGWKRKITLRHILNHTAGLWNSLPESLTLQRLSSCETCSHAYEYNPDLPNEMLLPTHEPGERCEYHYLSFGWLVAGALCGAYGLKHNISSEVKFEDVYRALLEPKLSKKTLNAGFRPFGKSKTELKEEVLAFTVTSDIRASKIMQRKREADILGEESIQIKALERFKGKEFLLDPRIWNCKDLQNSNNPAAGGRFSATGLASFYHDLSREQILQRELFDGIVSRSVGEVSSMGELQGVTRITSDGENSYTSLNFGFQRIRTDRDDKNSFSCIGHSGVGGSIGFLHLKSGLCCAVMLNKADADFEVPKRILKTIADHYSI